MTLQAVVQVHDVPYITSCEFSFSENSQLMFQLIELSSAHLGLSVSTQK